MQNTSIGRLIDSHYDHELDWIITERREALFRGRETVKRGAFCSEMGRIVGEVLIERLGDKSEELELHPDDFAKVGLDSLYSMTDDVLAGKAEAVSRYVAEACIVYAIGRTRGLKSAYSDSRKPSSEYWPFGQEGGFCNPMKLKMMDD